jgi:hypothetical protein
MLGAAVVRAAARRGAVQQQRRTMFEGPNNVIKNQAEMQKGATPYLRGEADPTYLRKSGDGAVAGVTAVLVSVSVFMLGWNHYRMWHGSKQ